MKISVSDEAVEEYARSLRSGGPLPKVFPCRLSECDFNDDQRKIIREARHIRAKAQKNAATVKVVAKSQVCVGSARPKKNDEAIQPLTKLRRLLYLQSGRCFFCGEELPEEQASIEHLVAKKWGGKSDEWNEVVCHKSLNATFGAMDLRSKFAFVIKSAGKLKCPR